MLVLSRKKHQSTIIEVPPSTTPTRIVLAQIDIRGDRSRLGFDAPREVKIYRSEIQEKLDQENVDNG